MGATFLACPIRFLQKYRTFYMCLQARQRHRVFHGRGTKSAEELAAIAGDLLDSATLAFAMALPGPYESVLRPFALRVQDVCDLPGDRWRARGQVLRGIDRTVIALRLLRTLMSVYVLAAPYVRDARGMKRFWAAWVFSVALHPLYHPDIHAPAAFVGIVYDGRLQTI